MGRGAIGNARACPSKPATLCALGVPESGELLETERRLFAFKVGELTQADVDFLKLLLCMAVPAFPLPCNLLMPRN
jgi:hypothetical protein